MDEVKCCQNIKNVPTTFDMLYLIPYFAIQMIMYDEKI